MDDTHFLAHRSIQKLKQRKDAYLNYGNIPEIHSFFDTLAKSFRF